MQAMESAGYKMDQNASLAVLTKKANAYDKAPYIQDRIAELQKTQTILESDTARPISPTVFDKLELGTEPMSLKWLNSAAYTVYRQALTADNFHQCLQTLKFIADLNGLGENLPKVGRPPHDKTPNDTQTSGNHEFDPNAGTPSKDESFDDLFEGSDGGDGESTPYKHSAARKIQTHVDAGSPASEDGDDGLDESDQWDTGFSGEDRD